MDYPDDEPLETDTDLMLDRARDALRSAEWAAAEIGRLRSQIITETPAHAEQRAALTREVGRLQRENRTLTDRARRDRGDLEQTLRSVSLFHDQVIELRDQRDQALAELAKVRKRRKATT